MARITYRTKPARSSRGKNPARASVSAAMTRKGGPQPSSGINGSPHGVNSRGSNAGTGDAIGRRKRFGQY